MSEHTQILADTVGRLFLDLMAEGQPDRGDLSRLRSMWQSVEELGITDLFLSEELGGFAGNWEDAYAVFKLSGYHAVPLPLGETIIAKKLLASAELDLDKVMITLGAADNASIDQEKNGAVQFSGYSSSLPWGELCDMALMRSCKEDTTYHALVATNPATVVQRDVNAADEPRDSLQFELTPVANLQIVDTAADSLFLGMSLLRTCQLAGALAAILELTVNYVQERKQFGRQISKFQVIQHQLAILAEHCAAVDCAAQSACRAYDRGDATFEIAAAKLRANRAVPDSTSIAHQLHGAIGFTKEHSLHHYTQRLWAWRSEYGNDRYWSQQLGEMITRAGHNNIWADITARSDTRRDI